VPYRRHGFQKWPALLGCPGFSIASQLAKVAAIRTKRLKQRANIVTLTCHFYAFEYRFVESTTVAPS
jgi:hypothetical protein